MEKQEEETTCRSLGEHLISRPWQHASEDALLLPCKRKRRLAASIIGDVTEMGTRKWVASAKEKLRSSSAIHRASDRRMTRRKRRLRGTVSGDKIIKSISLIRLHFTYTIS